MLRPSFSPFSLQTFVGYSTFAGVIGNRFEWANEREAQHNGGIIINNVNKILWFLWLFIIAHWETMNGKNGTISNRNLILFGGLFAQAPWKIAYTQTHNSHISFNLFHRGNFSLLFSADAYNVQCVFCWYRNCNSLPNEECRHHAKWFLNGFWLGCSKPHSTKERALQTNRFVCAKRYHKIQIILLIIHALCASTILWHIFPISSLSIWPNFVNYIYKLADKCVWLRFSNEILFGPICLIAFNVFLRSEQPPIIIKYHRVTIASISIPKLQNDSWLMIITL